MPLITIRGQLTTTSQLHIGSGQSKPRDLKTYKSREKFDSTSVQVQAVARAGERLVIPATSLKGVLRQAVDLNKRDDIFGSTKLRGSARLTDSYGPARHAAYDGDNKPPHYDQTLGTGVEAGVAISRTTGTAVDKKLFHREFVPPRVAFDVSITVRAADAAVAQEHAGHILAALQRFDGSESGLRLGSETQTGWGRLKWSTQDPATRALAPARTQAATAQQLVIPLQLAFDSSFLVNDPAWYGEQKPSRRYRRDPDGRAMLPGKSLKGGLRAQAERILRTLGKDVCSPAEPCVPPANREGLRNPQNQEDRTCLACQLFGATGWRAPLDVSASPLGGATQPRIQDHVAIDRFTGGGADGLKFDVQQAVKPQFDVQIRVNLGRIKQIFGTDGRDKALALLALTLRDLEEGDIPMGYGKTRGNGACRTDATWRTAFHDHQQAVAAGLSALRGQ